MSKSKNIIPEIAKLLGVEINEEFKITCNEENKYRFSQTNLQHYNEQLKLWCDAAHLTLSLLIRGEREIVKLPWQPKVDEAYWTYTGEDFWVYCESWAGSFIDFVLLKHGVVFRTKKEALNARPRIYRELTGNEWSDNNG